VSNESTQSYLESVSPFSEVVSFVLNQPSFLNASLTRIDNFLSGRKMLFVAEEVLVAVGSDNWAEPDMEINLLPNLIKSSFPRLIVAGENEAFRSAFRECGCDRLEYVLPMPLTSHESNSVCSDFTLAQLTSCIKKQFKVSHTIALELLASVFDFDNGHDLTRFNVSLKFAILSWTISSHLLVPPKGFFGAVKDMLDQEYLNGVEVGEMNDPNNELAYSIAFREPIVVNSYIPEMVNFLDNDDYLKQWIASSGINVKSVDEIIYSQLAKLCFEKDLSPKEMKSVVAKNIFMKNVVNRLIYAYQSVYGLSVFQKNPKKGITAEELEYRWLERMVIGNRIMINEPEKAELKKIQAHYNNQFTDFRLPAPLDITGGFEDLL
jgi:hypothetical protein